MTTRSNVITLPNKLFFKVYEEISKNSYIFHKLMKKDLNENEIWRIAYPIIHEKLMIENSKKRIVIVSDKSEELIQLLKEHLLYLFDIDIVGVCGSSNIDYMLEVCNPDVVISTIKLEGYEMITIHPIFSENDIEQLKKVLPSHIIKKNELIYKIYTLEDLKNKKYRKSNSDSFNSIKETILKNLNNAIKEEYKKYFMNIKEKEIIVINNIAFISHKYHETVKEETLILLENDKTINIQNKPIKYFITYATKTNKNHIRVCCELFNYAENKKIKELMEEIK